MDVLKSSAISGVRIKNTPRSLSVAEIRRRHPGNLEHLSDQDIQEIIDRLYEAAHHLVATDRLRRWLHRRRN